MKKDTGGNYNINNMVGADEWAENVVNNAFTNGAAIIVLRFATLAAREHGLVANPQRKKLLMEFPY